MMRTVRRLGMKQEIHSLDDREIIRIYRGREVLSSFTEYLSGLRLQGLSLSEFKAPTRFGRRFDAYSRLEHMRRLYAL